MSFCRSIELGNINNTVFPGAGNLQTHLPVHYLVKWMGCDELDIIPASEMAKHAPEEVIAYYERISPINKCFEEREKERLAMALRPVIVSKVEKMMHNESISSEQLFEAAVQEAITGEAVDQSQYLDGGGQEEVPHEDPSHQEDTAVMVQIPEEYQSDLPMLDQGDNWTTDGHIIPQ